MTARGLPASVGTAISQSANNLGARLRRVHEVFRRAGGNWGDSVGISTDQPTITDGTSASLTTSIQQTFVPLAKGESYRLLGNALPTWNGTFNVVNSGTNGLNAAETAVSFMLNGTTCEIMWRGGNSGGSSIYWIWVDDKPLTEQPVTISTPTVTRFTELVFPSAAVRQVDFYVYTGNIGYISWQPANSALGMPRPRNARMFFLGDSFLGGSAHVSRLGSWGPRLAHALDCEAFIAGQGGTGYCNGGNAGLGDRIFGDSSRLAPIQAVDPDVLIVFGGGNDNTFTPSQVQTAAALFLSTLAASNPSMPIIMVGVYPSDATTTNGATQAATNQALLQAAEAAPNVIGFIDPIGNADNGAVPAAFVASTAYTTGQRFIYKGAIYQTITNFTSGSSPSATQVQRLSWLFGTGSSVALAADGNRDFYYAGDDSVHGTYPSASYYASQIARRSYEIIDNYLASGTPTYEPNLTD